MKPCPHCGDPMVNPRRVQCGKPECKKRAKAERMRDYMRSYRATDGGGCRRREIQYRQAKRHKITCTQCGAQAEVTKPKAQYCGSECWQQARRTITEARHAQVVLWRKDPKWTRLPGPRQQRRSYRWICGVCPSCSNPFITLQPEGRYCSLRCQRRAAKDRRRAMRREAYVAPVNRRATFERDGWRCQLCDGDVTKDAVVPHPWAPVIDHVVPLARGGTHEPANVQTAHYMCNSIKSDDRDGWRGRVQAA